jgi:hypothetical protein
MKDLKKFIKTTIRDFLNENYDSEYFFNKGSYKEVFSVKNHPDKLIKKGKGVIEEAKLFKKYPNVSPKIYKIDYENNLVVVEKLDTISAQKDFDELINKDRGYIHNWGYIIFKDEKEYNSLRNKLTSIKGKVLLDRVREIVLTLNMKDIHSRNFGYDNNGLLKAIDI